MASLKSTILSIALLLIATQLQAQMDTPPEPYGGQSLMREFICDEMVYPENALREKTEGTVEVSFTVMTDGSKTNYFIKESVTPELDAEALRICKLIMFYPAVMASNHIIDDVTIPVKFNIKKYQRNCKKKGFDTYQAYEGPVDTSMQVYATKALDQAPQPVFEDPAMNFPKFIAENMKYPDIAFRQNISGDVELSFVVEISGRISNIEIVNPLGGGCTEEAISLLKQILWRPGVTGGKAVRSFMNARISFNLNNNTDHQYLPNNNNTTM
jgi:TonB family protein